MNNETMFYLEKRLTENQKISLMMNSHIMQSDVICEMKDFNTNFSGIEPLNLSYMIYYGDFNPKHNYYCIDRKGNLMSFSDDNDVIQYCWYPEILKENEKEITDIDFIQKLLYEFKEDE